MAVSSLEEKHEDVAIGKVTAMTENIGQENIVEIDDLGPSIHNIQNIGSYRNYIVIDVELVE